MLSYLNVKIDLCLFELKLPTMDHITLLWGKQSRW